MREVKRASSQLDEHTVNGPVAKRRRLSETGLELERQVRAELARSLSFLAAIGIDVVGHRASSECYAITTPTSLVRPATAQTDQRRIIYPMQSAIFSPHNKRANRTRLLRDHRPRKGLDQRRPNFVLMEESNDPTSTKTDRGRHAPLLDGDVLEHIYMTYVQPAISGESLPASEIARDAANESLTDLLLDGKDDDSRSSSDCAGLPTHPRQPSKLMYITPTPICKLGRRSGWLRPRSVDLPAAGLRPSPRHCRQRRESESCAQGLLTLAELSSLQTRLKQVLQQAPAMGAPKAATVAQTLAPMVLNKTLSSSEYLSLVHTIAKPVAAVAKRREVVWRSGPHEPIHLVLRGSQFGCVRRLASERAFTEPSAEGA